MGRTEGRRRGKANFSELKFGLISSEQESSEDPQLLLDGFYDQNHITATVVAGEKWLVLGPKGVGKSAISERIRLLAQSRSDWHVRKLELDEFPFVDIDTLDVGGATRGARLPAVWTYLLCLQIITSLESDEGFQQSSNSEIHGLIKSLRKAQLIPVDDPSSLVLRLKSLSMKIKTPGFELGVEGSVSTGIDSFYSTVHGIRDLVASVDIDATHFILIDGLDTLSLGDDDETRWAVLTALITACDKLSRLFRERRSPIRIVLLCRDDIFYKIGFADSNKILGSAAAPLSWFPGSRRAEDSELFDLAERKASVHAGDVGDVVGDYLPSEIRIGQNTWSIREFLMMHTRYLPRDFLQLLTYVARHSPSRGLPGMNAVIDGTKEYSTNYFVEEIRSGLLPVLGRKTTNLVVEMLGILPGSSFKLGSLRKFIYDDSRYRSIEIMELLTTLHQLGIIGNIVLTKGVPSYHNFIYHNPRSKIEMNGIVTLHNAATVGFGLTRKQF